MNFFPAKYYDANISQTKNVNHSTLFFVGVSDGNIQIGGSDILVSVQPHCTEARSQEVACALLKQSVV